MAVDPFLTLRVETLSDATKATFSGALGLALEGPLPVPPEVDGSWITSTIFFSGDWAGLVRLDLPRDLAAAVTADWRSEKPAELEKAAVNDAMGELVNTVAGILKPSLEGIRLISMPRVSDTSKALPLKGKSDLKGCTLRCGNHLLQLSVWKCPPQFKMAVVPKPDLRTRAST